MRLLKLEMKPKEKKYPIDPEMAMAAKCTAWQLSYRGNPVYWTVNQYICHGAISELKLELDLRILR